MLTALGDILNGILELPYLLVILLVEAVNGWILILAGFLAMILSILPGFPPLPTLNGDVVSGVAWFLPLGPMIAIFATFVTAWVIWMGISVIARWVKML